MIRCVDERQITTEDLEAAFLDPQDTSFDDMLARGQIEDHAPRTAAGKAKALTAERERIEHVGALHFADPAKRAAYVRQALRQSAAVILGRGHERHAHPLGRLPRLPHTRARRKRTGGSTSPRRERSPDQEGEPPGRARRGRARRRWTR